MDYSKIGNRLKLERERKGLSYEQIFEITRIQPSVLKEIENGNSSISSVLIKGFIKTYARTLGFDLEIFFKEIEEKEKKKEEERNEAKRFDNNEKNKKRNYLKYLLICFVISIAIWVLNPSKKTETKDLITIKEEESHTEKTATEETVTEDRIIKETATEKTVIEDRIIKETATEKETAIENKTISEKDSLEKTQTLFQQIKASTFTKDLLIQSSASLEIYFKVDKKSTITKILEPSVWFHIKAKESIYFRLDEKREDIQMFYNGKQVHIGTDQFFEKTFQ